MEIDKKEVLRYMGQFKGEAEPNIMAVIDRVIEEFINGANPKYVWRIYPIKVTEQSVYIEESVFSSRRLAAHLLGCEKAAVLAATLGTSADSIIRRSWTYGAVNASAAQAVGAAMIEAVCDEACIKIERETGLFAKPRFSPGYGDFDLMHQREMLDLCDAVKRAGITLSDSLMMIPTKSVTAIVGLTREKVCSFDICMSCDNKECEFRQ